MEETILHTAYENRLWGGETEQSHEVSLGTSNIYKKEYLEKGYMEIIINIDGVDIPVVVHSKIKRGTRSCFIYFRKQRGTRYNIYLNVEDVLDNIPFYTTNKTERRLLKIKRLKDKTL